MREYSQQNKKAWEFNAYDFWISAEGNAGRFEEWGIGEQVTPVCEDANKLSFDEKQFQALVSVDSYHYFAGEIVFSKTKFCHS